MSKSFYAAGALADAAVVDVVSQRLVQCGFRWTYDWTREPRLSHGDWGTLEPARRAHSEIEAIRECDFVVVVAPGGRGTQTEIGAACMAGKRVYLWVESPARAEGLLTPYPSVFHHHSVVRRVDGSLNELIGIICSNHL